MNELEAHNLHEHTIRSSITVLLFRGAVAWLLFAVLSYGVDELPIVLQMLVDRGTEFSFFTVEDAIQGLALMHFVLNILYGGLLLYVVLSWIFEYYIIRPDAIVVRQGILFSHEHLYQMEDIKSIEVHESFWGKLFMFGTIEFFAHRAQQKVFLRSIENPHSVAAHIHEMHPAPETVELTSARIGKGK